VSDAPRTISLAEWDQRYAQLRAAGLSEPSYGGPLGRHLEDGDYRLDKLRYDNSPAALRLWNFLLTEEARLHDARSADKTIVGAMKDLGTVPVMAYALPNVVAFYPDGAWWIPCVMELSAGLLGVADKLGIDESFCPVRAMLGAFVTDAHFPRPDLLTCSVGATCDDFSAIAQRLNGLGYPIVWWEMPHRRQPDPDEPAVTLPGGLTAPQQQVDFVRSQLEMVRRHLAELAGGSLDDAALSAGVRRTNEFRRLLADLRREVYTADVCPLPALEMLIAEMLAIHFCSDQDEAVAVIEDLLAEARRRVEAGQGVLSPQAAGVYWVNPVADIQAMNLLEECGGRIRGTDYMFTHALEEIPEDLPPTEALARAALADPMVGSARDRAAQVCRDVKRFGARGVVVSRIPGASHCATEGTAIAEAVRCELDLPVVELEIPPVSDPMRPTLQGRLEALIETIKESS
jgi:benzoyl-CoA reductase/2-hydroxyglutaryl-CoA dehydratase subunit BcrC/BadD/HgdB